MDEHKPFTFADSGRPATSPASDEVRRWVNEQVAAGVERAAMHAAMAQNSGIMPSALPRTPNPSGRKVWLAFITVVRTPTASPARPAGEAV